MNVKEKQGKEREKGIEKGTEIEIEEVIENIVTIVELKKSTIGGCAMRPDRGY